MPYTDTPTDTERYRVTVRLADLLGADGMVQYGIRIEIAKKASSNVGDYVFENVTFGFPTKNA